MDTTGNCINYKTEHRLASTESTRLTGRVVSRCCYIDGSIIGFPIACLVQEAEEETVL